MGVRKTAGRGRDLSPQDFLSLIDAPSVSEWHTAVFRCRLVTPMYGGGVKAGHVDRAMPIRATAIRGQLRHWWRFLNRFDSDGTTLPAKTLFERERAIWGGLGDANASSKHGALTKSQVMVAVAAPVVASQRLKSPRDYPRTKYALFSTDAQTELLAQDIEFVLTLSFPEALRTQIEECVRWWASFGGVGARTRRGLGAVRVKDDANVALAMPTAEHLHRYGCTLALLPCGDGKDPVLAWETSIGKLASFRQGIPFARNAGPGRSRWPEPDAIRSATGQALSRNGKQHAPVHAAGQVFPRAFFGLPIIFHFKDGGRGLADDPQDSELVPIPDGSQQHETRMASPLILRPMLHAGRWYAGALRLPTEDLLRAGLLLRSVQGHRELKRFAAGEWWDATAADKIAPLQGVDDPLAAFLRYFAGEASLADIASVGVASATPAANAMTTRRTFERPRLKWINSNGSLVIEPRDKQHKPVTLIRDEAQRCFDALRATTQHHLRTSKQPPFNRLTITIDGDCFVELQEHAE